MARKKIDKRPLEVIEDVLNDEVWSDHEISLTNVIREYQEGNISTEVYEREVENINKRAEDGEEESRKEALRLKGIPDDEWW